MAADGDEDDEKTIESNEMEPLKSMTNALEHEHSFIFLFGLPIEYNFMKCAYRMMYLS